MNWSLLIGFVAGIIVSKLQLRINEKERLEELDLNRTKSEGQGE